MFTRMACLGITSAVVLASAGIASAVPLVAPAASVAVFENDPVGGSVLISQSQPFATANYTGSLLTTVISGDTSNPYGGLTFTYKLTNDVNGANQIARLSLTNFQGYATDVSYQLATGDQAPTSMDRNTPDVVGFAFTGAPLGAGTLAQGETSDLLVIQTNALDYRTRIANVSNGSTSSVNTFGPSGAITPEPTSLVALAGGTLLLSRRRR